MDLNVKSASKSFGSRTWTTRSLMFLVLIAAGDFVLYRGLDMEFVGKNQIVKVILVLAYDVLLYFTFLAICEIDRLRRMRRTFPLDLVLAIFVLIVFAGMPLVVAVLAILAALAG